MSEITSDRIYGGCTVLSEKLAKDKPEYIEREAVKKALSEEAVHCLTFQKRGEAIGFISAKGVVSNIPAADVAEVKHGEWKVETYKTSNAKFIRCSICNSVIDSNFTHIDETEFDFCPYCGAKMGHDIKEKR